MSDPSIGSGSGAVDWDQIARRQRRRQSIALLYLGVLGILFAVGAVLTAGDGEDLWMSPVFAAMAAVLLGFAVGALPQLLGLVPAALQASFTDSPEELSAEAQKPGRAAFGMGATALAWLVLAILLTASGAAPLWLVVVGWMGVGAFLLLMLVGIRWSITAGGAEQTIDYRLFRYTDRIERVDALSFQQDKNWVWVHGPATRTWTVFGRVGNPTPRAKTVLVLAESPDLTLGELAAAIERHTGRPIHTGR